MNTKTNNKVVKKEELLKMEKKTVKKAPAKKATANKMASDVPYMPPKSVIILGQEYKIEVHDRTKDHIMKDTDLLGYCNEGAKLIVVSNTYLEPIEDIIDPERWMKKILRHETVHAYLNESGLSSGAMSIRKSWAKSEEVVDWIAIQGSKIYKTWEEMGLV